MQPSKYTEEELVPIAQPLPVNKRLLLSVFRIMCGLQEKAENTEEEKARQCSYPLRTLDVLGKFSPIVMLFLCIPESARAPAVHLGGS